ncbi:MAG: hypothetical protein U1F25_10670 [Rubrivivax sp.]
MAGVCGDAAAGAAAVVDAAMSPATPSPVPGPSTARVPSGSALCVALPRRVRRNCAGASRGSGQRERFEVVEQQERVQRQRALHLGARQAPAGAVISTTPSTTTAATAQAAARGARQAAPSCAARCAR